ncbi:unnamed protein product, partial [Ixodes hexagonus]
QEIDIIPVPFGVDLDMHTHFHCHPVVRMTDMKFMTGMRNPYADSTFAMAVGFDVYTWILITVSLLLIAALTVFLERTGIRALPVQIISYWALLFLEPSMRLPKTAISRILFGVWLLGTLVLSNWFQAVYCGSLLVQVPSARIDTAYDLLNASQVRPAAAKDVPLLLLMKTSPQEGLRRVYRKMQEQKGEVTVQTMYSLEFLRSIQNERQSVVIDQTSMGFVQEAMCPRLGGFFYFSRDVVDVLRMTWYTRKDLPADILRQMDQR